MTTWNPRYLAYCKAHGMEPEAMTAHDDQRWPGGCMTGYILWNQSKWAEFHKLTENRYKLHAGTTKEGHAEFDRWLNA